MARHPFGEGAHLDRRQFLKAVGFGAAGLMAGGWRGAFATPRGYRLRMTMSGERTTWPIYPGEESYIHRYNATFLDGDPSALQPIPGSFLGPTIRLNKGDNYSCLFRNTLTEPSIVHWHGLNLPESQDGLPQYAVNSGETIAYDYYVSNRAGTYWYHPHPDGRTGWQTYYGMAGVLIVSDNQEQALSLPRGEYDVPLVLQDRKVDDNNNFVYGSNPFLGTMGDKAFVNGFPNYVFSAATRAYRFRLVNASNARIYKLVWSDGTPLVVLGTDGGLLPKPVQKQFIMLAPGERIELWTDFRNKPLGSEITLKSLAFKGAQVGFGGGGSTIRNGEPIDLMKVRLDRQESEQLLLPRTLTPIERYRFEDAVNWQEPRRFNVTFDGAWLLNGEPFVAGEYKKNEVVSCNTLEVWDFVNESGSLAVAHPIHLHGPQFQILSRTVHPAYKAPWDAVRPGYVDEGWKDTVLLMPGETVRLLVKFGPHRGLSLYHCHNLDHEDTGMMRHYFVQ